MSSKFLAFALAWICVACPALCLADTQPGIRLSPLENRPHAYFVLPNGLRVVVVSDPTTQYAAACLTVEAGLRSDPEAYPGLAHLLEHMLFTSNKKYRDSYSLQTFFGKHGGFVQGETAGLQAEYFWRVRPDYIESALDRFSQMFITPMFKDDDIDQELDAVDAEFAARSASDGVAEIAANQVVLEKAKGRPREFPGNKASLGIDTSKLKDALQTLFDHQYSADHMALVVVGRDPVPELEKMVRSYFSGIPRRDWRPQSSFEADMQRARGSFVKVHGNEGFRELTFFFPANAWHESYGDKPNEYIRTLLDYPGEGGLMAALTDRRWITSQVVGSYSADADTDLELVRFALTPAGEAHIKDIGTMLFDYIGTLQRQGIKETLFDQQQRGAAIKFKYRLFDDAVVYARNLSSNLLVYQAVDAARAPLAWDTFDAGVIGKAIAAFSPNNLGVSEVSPDIKGDIAFDDYHTRYSADSVPESWQNAWRSARETPSDGFSMPGLSPYDPGEPERLALPEEDQPTRVTSDRGLDFWYAPNSTFPEPRVRLELRLSMPTDDPGFSAYQAVLHDALAEKLRSISYDGSVYGYELSVGSTDNGLEITASGYPGAFHHYVASIVDCVSGLALEQPDYDFLVAQARRNSVDALKRAPPLVMSGELYTLMRVGTTPLGERPDTFDGVSYEGFKRWLNETRLHYTGRTAVVGNLTLVQAKALDAEIVRLMPPRAGERIMSRTVKLTGQHGRVMRLDLPKSDAAILYYLQAADDSVKTRAELKFFGAVLASVVHQEFRQERRLGYVVGARSVEINRVPGLVVTMESPRASAAQLVDTTRTAMTSFQHVLQAIPDSVFNRVKQEMAFQMDDTPTSLEQYGRRVSTDLLVEPAKPDDARELVASLRALDHKTAIADYGVLLDSMDSRSLILYSPGGQGGPPIKGRQIEGSAFRKLEGVF